MNDERLKSILYASQGFPEAGEFNSEEIAYLRTCVGRYFAALKHIQAHPDTPLDDLRQVAQSALDGHGPDHVLEERINNRMAMWMAHDYHNALQRIAQANDHEFVARKIKYVFAPVLPRSSQSGMRVRVTP